MRLCRVLAVLEVLLIAILSALEIPGIFLVLAQWLCSAPILALSVLLGSQLTTWAGRGGTEHVGLRLEVVAMGAPIAVLAAMRPQRDGPLLVLQLEHLAMGRRLLLVGLKRVLG
jgi:hypothetical protein